MGSEAKVRTKLQLRHLEVAWQGRRVIIQRTVVATLLITIAAVGYYVFQPATSTGSIGFRPTFAGAARGEYPNGLPFGPSDVVASAVLEEVHQRNALTDVCGLGEFVRGFSQVQDSDAHRFLASEFDVRLREPRLSAVDRDRISEEYKTRRAALPASFRIIFTQPLACPGLESLTISKIMSDVVTVWADQSELRRGVTSARVAVLTPGVLDEPVGVPVLRVARGEVLRTALFRVLTNLGELSEVPGMELIRDPESGVNLLELRARLSALINNRLETLILQGSTESEMGEATTWISEARTTALEKQKELLEKEAVYRRALREYTGETNAIAGPTGRTPAGAGSSDLTGLAPQIDATFIDRIVRMSQASSEFRQELTRNMVSASIEAVEHGATAAHYARLLDTLRRPQGALSQAEFDRRLKLIADEGRLIVVRMNKINAEHGKVSMRPDAGLFTIEAPPTVTVVRPFTRVYLVLAVMLGAFLSLLGALISVVLPAVLPRPQAG